MSYVHTARQDSRKSKLLLAVALLALPLAGCVDTVDRTVPTASVPLDYHLRHPIALVNAPEHLDIFMVGASGRLDTRQHHDIQAFAEDYRTNGQGGVSIAVPHGAVDGPDAERTLDAVRHTLAEYGVRNRIDVGYYTVIDPTVAAPLHLRYITLQARGTSHCGDWPDDLNAGSSAEQDWQNHTYYNLGCGTTQTLAAQMDDPRDMVRPRAEDPSDVQLRTRAIGLLRGTTGVNPGEDPGTAWKGSALVPISTVGGQ